MKAIVYIVVGLVLIWGGGAELFWWARARRRVARVQGVIVGLADVGGQTTAIRSRAARFRFTTSEGHPVEAVSEMSSFPGPKPGKQVSVVYDPADPAGTAEIAGVRNFKAAVSPLIVAGGVIFVIVGASWHA